MKVECHSTRFWHNIFQSQVDNPPDRVEYIVAKPNFNLSARKKLILCQNNDYGILPRSEIFECLSLIFLCLFYFWPLTGGAVSLLPIYLKGCQGSPLPKNSTGNQQ